MITDQEYIKELESLFLTACSMNDTTKVKMEFEIIQKLYNKHKGNDFPQVTPRITTNPVPSMDFRDEYAYRG